MAVSTLALLIIFAWASVWFPQQQHMAAAISCKDQHGNDVDWFFASSIPHLADERGAWISTNVNPKPTWIANDDGVNAANGFLDNTMSQYKSAGVDMFVYNDYQSTLAHANGAVMWQTNERRMGDSALWITSSCPSFGAADNGYLFGNCFTKVQHIQCFTFDPNHMVSGPSTVVFGGGNLDPLVAADDTFMKDTAAGGRQLSMVLLHLVYRFARFTLQQCLNHVTDAAWLILNDLCNGQTVEQVNTQLNANYIQWRDSYTLQTDFITMGGQLMRVMSKKHNVIAGLWDDIVIPRLDDPNQLTTWRISTFMMGNLMQLPSTCCNDVTHEPSSIASCRVECRPRNFVYVASSVKTAMNVGNICNGYIGDGDDDRRGGDKAITDFVLAVTGEQTGGRVSTNKWMDLIAPACMDATVLTKADIQSLRDAAELQLAARGCTYDNVNQVDRWSLNRAHINDLPSNPNGNDSSTNDPYTESWPALSQDHSKLAWVATDNWVCAGDLNRHGGTKKNGIYGGNMRRGGGAVCWQSPVLRQSLDAFTEAQTHTCDAN